MSSHIHFVKILDFWVSPSFLSTVNDKIKMYKNDKIKMYNYSKLT